MFLFVLTCWGSSLGFLAISEGIIYRDRTYERERRAGQAQEGSEERREGRDMDG